MKNASIEIINKLGLHARAASKLASVAARYSCKITIGKDGKDVDGKSIMSLMLLAASQGTLIEVRCDGEDEQEAMADIEGLINRRFDEPE